MFERLARRGDRPSIPRWAKTAARGFDGYKGHVALDPDSELITATAATAVRPTAVRPTCCRHRTTKLPLHAQAPGTATRAAASSVEVFGDASYGTADLRQARGLGASPTWKCRRRCGRRQPLPGTSAEDAFEIDLEAKTVRCPAGVLVQLRKHTADGGGLAMFAVGCSTCALRSQCAGRAIRIHRKEATLQRYRAQQRSTAWKTHDRATRPEVERKLAPLMQRRRGGRRARVRGAECTRQDFAMRAAAHNLARLARFGVRHTGSTWGG